MLKILYSVNQGLQDGGHKLNDMNKRCIRRRIRLAKENKAVYILLKNCGWYAMVGKYLACKRNIVNRPTFLIKVYNHECENTDFLSKSNRHIDVSK